MKATLRLAILLIAGLLAACATKPEIQFTQDANFASFHSFSWLPVEHEPPVENPILDSEILDRRVKDAAIEALSAQGFEYVSDSARADFLVTYQTATEQEIRSSGGFRFGVGIGYPFYNPFFNPFFGSLYFPVMPYQVDSYLRGFLIMDIVDAATHELVWRGWTDTPVRPDNFDRESVGKMVRTILTHFPPP